MFVEHKEVGETTEAPTRIAKLSDAIRIGARLRPKCSGRPFKDGGSCAWGAAADAFGYVGHGGTVHVIEFVAAKLGNGHNWAWDKKIGNEYIADVVWRRNDGGESREDLADWLEAQGY